jgi:peptidoglycan hydrolase-like protein with peptidoglycan-binding domain
MLGDLPEKKRKRIRARYVVPVLLAAPFIVAGVSAAVIASSKATIHVGANSLAAFTLPTGGGTVQHVAAVGGPEQKVVATKVVGRTVLPAAKVAPGEKITVEVTIKRPSWISWLSGKTERVTVTERTPVVHVASRYVTRKPGQPVTVKLTAPATMSGHGDLGVPVATKQLPVPSATLKLQEGATAGTADVAVAARTWERPTVTNVSWFPAGSKATAVASPSPGTKITPDTKIRLTFSKPVTKVLGKNLPPVSPKTAGAWRRLNSHTIVYQPTGYGYGLGADVKVALPEGVNLIGGQPHGSDPIGQWYIPNGSTLALQQLLAQLGYLPLTFTPTTPNDIASTPGAEEAAIVNPPQGSFSWRYPNTPAQLKKLWSATDYTELTKGAVMAFEEDQGLPTDGVPGPDVWKALINAAVKSQDSTFGYTFVMVSETSPESIQVWHNGKIVVEGAVNTGISAAPTALGTYAVYEREVSGTMSGKNPDGTTYHDPDIPWISYFNGGDALHGFIRSSYGFPQSLGCVEMPFSRAGAVYPFTPIGTIVNLTA